jgi:hypothetical protein
MKCLRNTHCAGWRRLSSKLSSRRLTNFICFCVTFQRGPFLCSLNILNRTERVFYFFIFYRRGGPLALHFPSLPSSRAPRLTRPPVCAGGGGLLVFSVPGSGQPKLYEMEQQILGILGGSASDQSKVHSNPKTPFNTARNPTRSLLTSSSACRHPQPSLPIACRATPSLRQGRARRRRCGRQADLTP